MKKIKNEECIDLIKEKFPKFMRYWDDCIKKFGPDLGITIQMIPFCEYTIDIIKTNNKEEIVEIFNFVEFLMCSGDDSVQNAITTSYLENLMNKDPDEIEFSEIVKYLGKSSITYCKAWDDFTGVRTKGLWEESDEKRENRLLLKGLKTCKEGKMPLTDLYIEKL